MIYKLQSTGNGYTLTKDSSKYNMKVPKDIIDLYLDSTNQNFIANIREPSEHTLYLLNEGLLGIALCKVNTGASQRTHKISKHYEMENGEEVKIPNDYVKRHFHPRWSRCDVTVFPVQSLTDIELPIQEFENGCYSFKPNQAHTIHNRAHWCTKIKATLVSCGQHALGTSYSFQTRASDRAYKSYSTMVPIVYDNVRDMILNRGEPVSGGGGGGSSGFRVEQLSSNTFRITFSNLSEYWLGETVEILMATKDISNMHKRTWYKSHYDYDDNPRQYSVHTFVQYHSNQNGILATIDIDSNDTYVDVTLPNLSNIDIESPYIHRRVYHAYEQAQHNHFRKGNFYYNSDIYIQVRKYEHDTKMICLNGTGSGSYKSSSFNTGLQININTNT